jgi:hypothetical protein
MLALVSATKFSKMAVLPAGLLDALNAILLSLYSLEETKISAGLGIIEALTQLFGATEPSASIVQRLVAMQTSICCWILDEQSCIPHERYNKEVSHLVRLYIYRMC